MLDHNRQLSIEQRAGIKYCINVLLAPGALSKLPEAVRDGLTQSAFSSMPHKKAGVRTMKEVALVVRASNRILQLPQGGSSSCVLTDQQGHLMTSKVDMLQCPLCHSLQRKRESARASEQGREGARSSYDLQGSHSSRFLQCPVLGFSWH